MITQTFSVAKDELKELIIDKPGKYLVELKGSGAQAKIKGAFLAEKKEQIKVEVVIHHQAPNTNADTTLKGVGKDQSHISFTGRIIIDPECGNSNSFLTERIILLSDEAKAEAVPDLEILTDDVKCSHAASISRIPEEHLFYLQSRGISRQRAEEMIVEGFLDLG